MHSSAERFISCVCIDTKIIYVSKNNIETVLVRYPSILCCEELVEEFTISTIIVKSVDIL